MRTIRVVQPGTLLPRFSITACTPLLSLLALVAGLFISAAQSSGPIMVDQATDVVNRWQPGQRLYVKGNLGVSASSLAELEGWLDQNATNWTVVLVENASGEHYTDAEGQSFDGVEAVNHALGKGLMNQTIFGQQVDPRTHERNAAFFILFLKERKLSYFGSDAQDRRGLGEEDWIGKLDAPAIAAMRNGARVVDAVKDTVTNIDKRLTAHIASAAQEQQRRAQAAEAAKREAIERAKAALESAQATFLLAEAKAGDFARTYTGLTGDLARPDLPALKADLQAVQLAVEQNDALGAQKRAEALRDHVQRLVRAWEQYAEDEKRVKIIAGDLKNQQARPHAGTAAQDLQAAAATLETARREYARGDSAYVPLLTAAAQAVQTAAATISRAERLAQQRRILWGMGLFSALAAAAVVGVLLNRRRAPVKAQALQLHESWQQALSEKTTALFGLLDRRGHVVGGSAEDAAQHYSGESLRLSQQLIQDVDELFIMSSCAGRVLERAHGLLEPRVAWSQLANVFLAGRYRRAVGLLRDEPIAFRPDEGLELVVRGSRTERDRLLGGLSSYQPFTMSFNDLVAAFNQRAERALGALELLETSLQNAPGRLHSVQETIEKSQSQEAALTAAAQRDGFFRLQPVFSELLPAARKALVAARQTAISDPVGALKNEGSRALQQAENAAALLRVSQDSHDKVIPALRECAEALGRSGIDVSWIDAALKQLSLEADQAAQRALERQAEPEINKLRAALAALDEAGREAITLDELRRTQSQRQIAESTEKIKKGRAELAQGLGKAPGETLREQGLDPTDVVTQAQGQFEAVFAALSRGDLKAAGGAIESVTELTSQANRIVNDSLQAFAAYRETLNRARTESTRVEAIVPEHARILGEITAQYSPTVLALGAGDPTHPNANGTLSDNIAEAETHLKAARGALDKAEDCFRDAKVLESAALLGEAEHQLETTCYRLTEIAQKRTRLTETETANRELFQELELRRQECGRLAEEPTSMTPTVDAFDNATRELDQTRAAASAPSPDPFAVAASLAQLKRAFESVVDLARADRQLHEQAGRSLAAAARQMATAEQEAANTAHDNLPDSAAIHQTRTAVSQLALALQVAQEHHRRAHGDWHSLDQEANRVATEAASATATLRHELQQAQACVAAMSLASQRVRAARGWSGGFGVLIGGAPGSDLLAQAHGLLERGEYILALQSAENARHAADRAIAQAQAEERRRREEEEARIERERRRRQAEEARRQSSFSSSSSSFGRSSSWGSSGSGSRTSSFRSGSGVRTSSW